MSRFWIFLYSIEQLDDEDTVRSQEFRHEMQQFLGLTKKIKPFPQGNVNHFIGESRHEETVNICKEQFDKLRLMDVTIAMIQKST